MIFTRKLINTSTDSCSFGTSNRKRKQLALKRHNDRYLWERSTNHVKAEWERARKKEAEEQQRLYEEWLRQEVRWTEEKHALLSRCAVGNRTVCSNKFPPALRRFLRFRGGVV